MEGREQNRSVFFCRNIGGEYCLYISSSSNPMSIMECLTLQKKSAAVDSANFSESNGRLVMGFSKGKKKKKKKKKKRNKDCST